MMVDSCQIKMATVPMGQKQNEENLKGAMTGVKRFLRKELHIDASLCFIGLK